MLNRNFNLTLFKENKRPKGHSAYLSNNNKNSVKMAYVAK